MALDRLTKVDGGGISTTSDYRVGIITASKFVGPFDGTGGNFSGVVTATSANFTGNVTIGGTLTYEDVTNIDSVGIITAQNDIHVGAGVSAVGVGTFGSLDISGDIDVDGHTNLDNVSVAGVTTFSDDVTFTGASGNILFDKTQDRLEFDNNIAAAFGDGRNLRIFANSSNGQINNYTGDLYIQNDSSSTSEKIYIRAKGAENSITATADGSVELYYNDVKSFETTPLGIKVPDSKRLSAGDDEDLKIYHNGSTNSFIAVTGGQVLTTNSDSLVFKNASNNETYANFTQNGAVELYHDNTKTFSTNSLGISVYQRLVCEGTAPSILLSDTNHQSYTITADANALTITDANNGNRLGFNANGSISAYGFFNCNNSVYAANGFSTNGNIDIDDDGDKLRIGAGNDLQIYHSTFNYIESYNDAEIHINANTGGSVENMAKFKPNGAVELYHNGTKKFETGSSVNINSNHLEITSGLQLRFDNSNNNRSSEILNDGSSGNSVLTFKTNGGNRWTIDSSGHFVKGTAGAVNIGSASAEIGDVYLADDKRLTLGSDNDMYVFHDNIHGYVSNRKANLYLSAPTYVQIISTDTNGSNQQTSARFLRGEGAEIYYANSVKLSTISKGISVTGEVAATQDYPNFRPTIDFNFAATKKLDPRITYTRTGTASHYTELGLLKVVGDNAPRFDYDPVTRESKGLLIEESRTNAKTSSQDFSTGWNISGVLDYRTNNDTSIETPEGITDGVGVMPLIEVSGGSAHQFYAATTTQVTKYITYSVFAKPNGRNHIQHQDGPFVHDLVNGTTSGSATGEYVSATTTKLANGWCRCTMTRNHNNSYDQFNLKLHNGSAPAYSGDGSSGVYIWGVQQEDGQFATSYIPTNGAAATRGGDIVDIDGEDFTDFYNQSESTIISSHTLLTGVPNAENVYVYQIQDASTNNAIRVIDKNSSYSNVATALILNSGSSVAHFNNTTDSFTKDKVLVALSVKNNDFAASHNGGTVESDTSGTLATNFNSIGIGRYPPSGGYELNGHFQRFIYYPKQLSDNQLQTLSS